MANTSINISSPGRTPGKRGVISNGGDRFIPTRSTTNFELGYYKFQQKSIQKNNESKCSHLSKQKMQRLIGETFLGSDITNLRVLSFQNKVVQSESYQSPTAVKSLPRQICDIPERIVVAPIRDDYYLNLVDWQASNTLAIGLDDTVYLWNAKTAATEQLLQLQGNDYVCSVSWVKKEPYLAIGTSYGNIELWDCVKKERVRVIKQYYGRVGVLSWNSNVLSSGSSNGQIAHHDIRQDKHCVGEIFAHHRDVCGLKWSLDGKYLASGGNDHSLKIWPSMSGQKYASCLPLFSLNQHQAAVRALAWCPWQSHVLASGGGACDKSIKFWNIHSGILSKSVDTESQVCSLLWSNNYKEIVSGQSNGPHNLFIWKYPSMKTVAQIKAHGTYGRCRVLYLALSPDETTVLSVGSDENLKLWRFFPNKKKPTTYRSAISHHFIR